MRAAAALPGPALHHALLGEAPARAPTSRRDGGVDATPRLSEEGRFLMSRRSRAEHASRTHVLIVVRREATARIPGDPPYVRDKRPVRVMAAPTLLEMPAPDIILGIDPVSDEALRQARR